MLNMVITPPILRPLQNAPFALGGIGPSIPTGNLWAGLRLAYASERGLTLTGIKHVSRVSSLVMESEKTEKPFLEDTVSKKLDEGK
ncbi:MAG: hypothetical protein H8E10_11595 [Desulfobacterales bacterium]|nr:hypothetical protein [Desulfobacterales bacterium]